MDMGKLAMWRLRTHDTFGGTWLSDYLTNRLGFNPQEQGVEPEARQAKPKCPLIGADGNIFGLMGLASRTLKDNGMAEQAQEMRTRVTATGSYDETLTILMEYVDPVDEQEMETDDMGEDMAMGEMEM